MPLALVLISFGPFKDSGQQNCATGSLSALGHHAIISRQSTADDAASNSLGFLPKCGDVGTETPDLRNEVI